MVKKAALSLQETPFLTICREEWHKAVQESQQAAPLHRRVDAVCARLHSLGSTQICKALADAFDLQVDVKGSEQNIPENGPVLVASNHPYGTLDDILLGAILERQRPDYKIFMVQSLLDSFPSLAALLTKRALGVQRGAGCEMDRAGVLRQGVRHLSSGGCVALFPAGHTGKPKGFSRQTQDYPWQSGVAHLLLSAKDRPAFVPVYFEKETPRPVQFYLKIAHALENTEGFNAIGVALRSSASIHDLKKPPRPITLTIGQPCSLEALLDRAAVTLPDARRDKQARHRLVQTMQAMTMALSCRAAHR